MKNDSFAGKCFIVAFSVCLFASPLIGQSLTGGQINGKGWKTLGSAKIVYLMGLEDGFAAGLIHGRFAKGGQGITSEEFQKEFFKVIPDKFNRNEVISEIDSFYEEAANVLIPVRNAVEWVSEKMKGASSAALQERIIKIRQLYINY